ASQFPFVLAEDASGDTFGLFFEKEQLTSPVNRLPLVCRYDCGFMTVPKSLLQLAPCVFGLFPRARFGGLFELPAIPKPSQMLLAVTGPEGLVISIFAGR